MATSSKQAFHKNLECPVCLRFFKDPKILTCSHTFCKGCLEKILEYRRSLSCPTCRGETSVPGGDVGRLQSNITVRSLVEDLETQGQSNCNQEDKPLQRKWNKCQKHPNYDEECFCLDCNQYVCCQCAILEHIMNAHTILDAGVHETAQKLHVEELASKADAKVSDVDKYVTFVAGQRKRVHNIHEQRKNEINETFEESVQKLWKRKTVLENEVGHELGKLETSLGDMEESGRKQKDKIKRALDSVKNGLNFPLQTEALTSHRATCQQLEELLSLIGPVEELPRSTAEEGERVCFRSQGSDGLYLGQIIRQKKSKWIMRTKDPLHVAGSVQGMAISPNNEMAVVCGFVRGIVIYSSNGIIKGTVLECVRVRALHFMPDGGYVIRDNDNRISMSTDLSEKLDVTFETMADGGSVFCSLTVGKDGLIFTGSNTCKKIQVFRPEGGKAVREIKCNGFAPWQMFAMTSSQAIVLKDGSSKVHVINDVSGAIIHTISKDGAYAYPAVCQDSSVIIAWVNEDQDLLSIVQYTKELKYIKNIITDFKIIHRKYFEQCYLQEFKTGEIAFCISENLYIFHETQE